MEESTKALIEHVKNVLRTAFPGRNFYAVFAVSDEDTYEYETSELTACSCSSYVEDAQSGYEMVHLISAAQELAEKHRKAVCRDFQTMLDSEERMSKSGKPDEHYLKTYQYET